VALNTQQIISIAEKIGLSQLEAALPVMVEVAQMSNPTASDQEIIGLVDGNLKHSIRGKIGFAVDFIWPMVEPTLINEIGNTLTTLKNTPTPPPGNQSQGD
jgi:hypothetical protein